MLSVPLLLVFSQFPAGRPGLELKKHKKCRCSHRQFRDKRDADPPSSLFYFGFHSFRWGFFPPFSSFLISSEIESFSRSSSLVLQASSNTFENCQSRVNDERVVQWVLREARMIKLNHAWSCVLFVRALVCLCVCLCICLAVCLRDVMCEREERERDCFCFVSRSDVTRRWCVHWIFFSLSRILFVSTPRLFTLTVTTYRAEE